MEDKIFEELMKRNTALYHAGEETVEALQNKIVARMLDASRRETDRLEHHLLEMPLSVIIYKWVILRLKCRPWRLLAPASVALTLLLHGVLSRVNLLQWLTH